MKEIERANEDQTDPEQILATEHQRHIDVPAKIMSITRAPWLLKNKYPGTLKTRLYNSITKDPLNVLKSAMASGTKPDTRVVVIGGPVGAGKSESANLYVPCTQAYIEQKLTEPMRHYLQSYGITNIATLLAWDDPLAELKKEIPFSDRKYFQPNTVLTGFGTREVSRKLVEMIQEARKTSLLVYVDTPLTPADPNLEEREHATSALFELFAKVKATCLYLVPSSYLALTAIPIRDMLRDPELLFHEVQTLSYLERGAAPEDELERIKLVMGGNQQRADAFRREMMEWLVKLQKTDPVVQDLFAQSETEAFKFYQELQAFQIVRARLKSGLGPYPKEQTDLSMPGKRII